MSAFASIISAIGGQRLWSSNIKLRRGDFLCMAADINTKLYLLQEGAVRIYIMDGDTEQNIRFGYADDIVTALDCYLTGRPTAMYIQALRKTTLRSISKSQYEQLLQQDEKLAKIWTAVLESFVYQQIEREVDLLTSSPADRYQRVLSRSPRLLQEVPLRHIANYLRMTPETLSRIRKS